MKEIPKRDEANVEDADPSDVSGGIAPPDGCFPMPIDPIYPEPLPGPIRGPGYPQPGYPDPSEAFTGV